jgi:hypothetical protein
MRYAKISALGTFAAAALCCGSAMAQQTYQLYQTEEARIASPTVADSQIVDLSVNEFYDSNVARSDEALAQARGLQQADWFTQVGVNATIIQTLGLQRFFVSASGEYTWYVHNHELDAAFAHVNGGDSLRLGQCAVTAQGDYFRKRSDDVPILAQAVENVTSTGSLGLDFSCPNKTFGLAPSVSATERWNTNSSDILRNADNRVFTGTAGLDYRNPILGSLGFFAEYDDVKFDHAILDVNGTLYRDSFYDWSWGGRFVKQFDSRFSVMATLTYTEVGSNIPDGPDFHGVTYSFDATYNPLPRLFAHADVSRQVLPSDEPYASYMVDEQYEADMGFAVGQKIRLGLRGAANHMHFMGTTAFDPQLNLADQTIYRVDASAGFNVNPHLWLELFAGEQHGDVNLPGYNYWSTQVGVRAKASFGHP